MAEKDYVALNRAGWTKSNEQYTDRSAHGAWAQEEITWGQWGRPEREVQMLPELAGKDVIELGCGTAYFGAWLKRRYNLPPRIGARIPLAPMAQRFGESARTIEVNRPYLPGIRGLYRSCGA